MHYVDIVGIFVLLKFESKLDTIISHFTFNSKHRENYKFAEN